MGRLLNPALVALVLVVPVLLLVIKLYGEVSRKRKVAAAKLFTRRERVLRGLLAVSSANILFLAGRVISIVRAVNFIGEEVIDYVRIPLDLLSMLVLAYSFYEFYVALR